MENVVFKKIMLPEHEKAVGTRRCYECHGVMNPCTHESMFSLPLKSAKVAVSGIQAHKCEVCGEVVYSSAEAKLIETEIKKVLSQVG